MQLDPGVAALGGAFIGGGMVVVGDLAKAWYAHRKERRSLTIAMGAEVAAVAELVRRRQWLLGVSDAWVRAQQGQVIRQTIRLPQQILVVTRAAAQDAGQLPGKLAILVPRLVMLGDGIKADLDRLFEFPTGHENSLLDAGNAQGARDFYAELYGILDSALCVCDEIVAEVARLYPDFEPARLRHQGVAAASFPQAVLAEIPENISPTDPGKAG